jgi:hypothetical protein
MLSSYKKHAPDSSMTRVEVEHASKKDLKTTADNGKTFTSSQIVSLKFKFA